MTAFPYLFRKRDKLHYTPLVATVIFSTQVIGTALWCHYSDAIRGQLIQMQLILPQAFPLFMFAAVLDTLFVASFVSLILAALSLLVIMWRHWMEHQQDSTGQVNEGSNDLLDLGLYSRINTALRCSWWLVQFLLVYLLAGDSALGVLIWSTRYQFEMAADNQAILGNRPTPKTPECYSSCVDLRSMVVVQSVYPDSALCICNLETIEAVYQVLIVAVTFIPGLVVGISLMYASATLQAQRLNIDYGHASKERDVLVRLMSDSEAPGSFASPVAGGPRPGTGKGVGKR